MSEPDLLPEVLPAAENSAPVSAIRDRQRPMLMPLAASGTAGLRRDLISSALIPITEVPPAQTSVPADISQYRQAVMQ